MVTLITGGTSDSVATSAKYLIVKHSSTQSSLVSRGTPLSIVQQVIILPSSSICFYWGDHELAKTSSPVFSGHCFAGRVG